MTAFNGQPTMAPPDTLEPVYDLFGVALGRNRDELLANIAQHGLMPMQGIWWANRPLAQPVGCAPCDGPKGGANATAF
ncbi:MAG: hypothetical protein ACREXQ_11215, partial [Polaromonas sp.]